MFGCTDVKSANPNRLFSMLFPTKVFMAHSYFQVVIIDLIAFPLIRKINKNIKNKTKYKKDLRELIVGQNPWHSSHKFLRGAKTKPQGPQFTLDHFDEGQPVVYLLDLQDFPDFLVVGWKVTRLKELR